MKKHINIHFIFVLLAAALWGTAGLFVRTVNKFNYSEMQTVFWRAALSALILAVIVFFKDRSLFKIRLRDLWLFIGAGVFSIILFNFSYYTTMSLTSLSVAAVLLYTAPFFVVIMSLFLFGERLTLNKCIACATAFIGCCFVSGLFDSSQRISGKALFFGLLTGFGYALYTIFGELLLKKGYATLTITFYVFLSAAVFCLPFINVTETVPYTFAHPKALGIMFLFAVFNTVIPYILYTAGLKGVEPSVAPIVATLEPVVATVIGAVIFREAITLSGGIGILLVLGSVAILNCKAVTAVANAKINITLAITGKRDDGYHFIDTVMHSVSLADTVTVRPAKKIRVICKGVNEEENIAYKAAKLFFEETGILGGAKITVKKRIPMSAGLGGGSADAAAVLLTLDRLFKTELDEQKLCEIAVKLGADVPFFIKGGCVRAEGIGEILTPVSPLKSGYFLLAKGDKKPSTGEMYRRLDSENPPLPDTNAAIKAIESNDVTAVAKALGNSFTAVWNESKIKTSLEQLDPLGVSLSGSGPTWFALFEDLASAKRAKKALKAQKTECYIVKPCDFAIKFE